MSTDNPRPGRVTLSDEERELIDATLADVAGSVLPTAMHRTVERILAAREQALARVIREAKAEAWDEGAAKGAVRALGLGGRMDAIDPNPMHANPYREQSRTEERGDV